MRAAYRLTILALAAASILLASTGVVLAVTWAFPDVHCSGDVCLMTWNVFTIPAMLVGTGLGITAVIVFVWQRFGGPLTAKHK